MVGPSAFLDPSAAAGLPGSAFQIAVAATLFSGTGGCPHTGLNCLSVATRKKRLI
jgi:hypothetical protein